MDPPLLGRPEPLDVLSSTIHLRRTLAAHKGLQRSRCDHLQELVLSTFVTMHDWYERHRRLIRPGRLSEIGFAALLARPLQELSRVYDELSLPGFQQARPAIEAGLAARTAHRRNRFELTPAQRDMVARRWRDYADRHGYSA